MTVYCNKRSTMFGAALFTAFFAAYAVAAPARNDNNGLAQMLQTSGVVGAVQDNHRFTLHNDSWESGNIEIVSQRPITLHEGDLVRVTGTTDYNAKNGALRIVADEIKLSSASAASAPQVVPATMTREAGGANSTGAPEEHTSIKDLPPEGQVKVIGVVDNIPDTKSLSLRDNTGTLQVNTEALDKPLPAVGTEVTILGAMQSSLLQKELIAQKLSAVSSPPTQAQK